MGRDAERILASVHDRITSPIQTKSHESTTIEALFPRRAPDELSAAIETVTDAFAGRNTVDALGDQLQALQLEPHQQNRVFGCLAEVYLSLSEPEDDRQGLPLTPFQTAWHHILAKLGYSVDVLRRGGLRGAEAEQALLVSLFSDCADQPHLNRGGQFLGCHLDGAAAAHHVLSRNCQDTPPLSNVNLASIVAAIKEQSVSPPTVKALIVKMMGTKHPDADVLAQKLADPLWFPISMAALTADAIARYATLPGLVAQAQAQDYGTRALGFFSSLVGAGLTYLDAGRLLPPRYLSLYDGAARQTERILRELAGAVDAKDYEQSKGYRVAVNDAILAYAENWPSNEAELLARFKNEVQPTAEKRLAPRMEPSGGEVAPHRVVTRLGL